MWTGGGERAFIREAFPPLSGVGAMPGSEIPVRALKSAEWFDFPWRWAQAAVRVEP